MPSPAKLGQPTIFLYALCLALQFCASFKAIGDDTHPVPNSPWFTLQGKIIAPNDVSPDDLICEAIERYNAGLGFFRQSIALNQSGQFETKVQGLQSSVVIHARTKDNRLQAYWNCSDTDLRTKCQEKIELTLAPAADFRFRLVHEGKPMQGAMLIVDGFCTAIATSNEEGFATAKLPAGDRPLVAVAYHQEKQLAQVKTDFLGPSEYTPFLELKLDRWDVRSIRVEDTTGKPLPNIRVSAGPISDLDQKNAFALPEFSGLSDQLGETTPLWFSDELWRLKVLTPGYRIVSNDAKSHNRLVLAKMTPDVVVEGRIDLPEGVSSGLLIEGQSQQSERPNSVSMTRCRVNEDGSFRLPVHPNYTYSIFVDDAEWLSKNWEGVLARSDSTPSNKPKLEFTQGESVEVLLMEGPELTPAPNVFVRFDSQGGRRWYGVTNEDGVVSTRALPGDYHVYVNMAPWREDLNTKVVEGDPKVIMFHRQLEKTFAFRGKLNINAANKAQTNWETCELVLLSADDYRFNKKISVDKDGNFRGESPHDKVALVATSSDKQSEGFVIDIIGSEEYSPLEITLNSTVAIRGKTLDADGFPLEGLDVQIDPRAPIAWRKEDGKRGFFDLRTIYSNTDSSGRFSVESIVSGAPIAGFMSFQGRGNGAETLLYNHSIEPGETRTLPTLVHDIDASMFAVSIGTRLERRVSSAKLMNTNVLFVLHGSAPSAKDTAKILVQRRNETLMRHCLPMVISNDALAIDPAKADWVSKQGWPIPNQEEVFVAILGRSGQVLMKRLLTSNDNVATLSELMRPSQLDLEADDWNAARKFKSALQQATSSNRDVWLSVLDPNDGTALALKRWQEVHRETLEKSFVMLSFDLIRDEGVFDVLEKESLTLSKKPINLLFSPDGSELWNEQQQETKELKYFCIDRAIMEPLLKAATQRPVEVADLSKLLHAID